MSAAIAFVCLIVAIADGDTLTGRCPTEDAAHPYAQVKVRLAGIDAPEKGQPYGRASRKRLADLCFHVHADIRVQGKDRFGRTVARVDCEGRNASLEMVRSGLAWAQIDHSVGKALQAAELAARQQLLGLWADLDTATPPIPPWEFRQLTQAAAPDATTCFTDSDGRRNTIVTSKARNGC